MERAYNILTGKQALSFFAASKHYEGGLLDETTK